MPIYEYECGACGRRFEELQRMTDDPLTTDPECGGDVHRVIQPVGIIFKGAGFYATDSRKSSSTTSTSSDSGSTKSESSTSDTSKSESGKSESSTSSASSKSSGDSTPATSTATAA